MTEARVRIQRDAAAPACSICRRPRVKVTGAWLSRVKGKMRARPFVGTVCLVCDPGALTEALQERLSDDDLAALSKPVPLSDTNPPT